VNDNGAVLELGWHIISWISESAFDAVGVISGFV
jgi:hypothetical protein